MARVYKENEIKLMREGGKKLADIVKKLSLDVKKGNSPQAIEKKARQLIKKTGGSPSFLYYRGFPKAVCISVNEEVVHTEPSNYKFRKGDLVSIDVGLKYKGYHTDMAVTVPVGKISQKKRKFLNTCKKALDKAIKLIKPGISLGTIGSTIQNIAEKENFSVVKELTGHGVGKNLHEAPTILNYGGRGTGEKLKKGMVLAIEPIINMGKPEIISLDKEWRIITKDKSLSCHFEHTVAVTEGGSDILTK